MSKQVERFFAYFYFGVNVLDWCVLVHLFDTSFQISSIAIICISILEQKNNILCDK